jgi:hypothetical protein
MRFINDFSHLTNVGISQTSAQSLDSCMKMDERKVLFYIASAWHIKYCNYALKNARNYIIITDNLKIAR